jgi:hypothetical protein
MILYIRRQVRARRVIPLAVGICNAILQIISDGRSESFIVDKDYGFLAAIYLQDLIVMIVWISKLVLLVVERQVMANFGVRGRIS